MKCRFLLMLVIISQSVLTQNMVVPEAFKNLQPIKIKQDTSIFAYLPKDYITKYEISDAFFENNFVEEFIGVVKLSGSKDSEFLMSFTSFPSDDPRFSFYKKALNDYEFAFSVAGKIIYVQGNGYIYVSGHTNNMSDLKRKFKFENDSLTEIKQPFYYVGLKTKTLKPIRIYLEKNEDELGLVASLPANAEIEVVASEFTEIAKYFLIKTSFGLVGWWKLDTEYSEVIDKLYFAGD